MKAILDHDAVNFREEIDRPWSEDDPCSQNNMATKLPQPRSFAGMSA